MILIVWSLTINNQQHGTLRVRSRVRFEFRVRLRVRFRVRVSARVRFKVKIRVLRHRIHLKFSKKIKKQL